MVPKGSFRLVSRVKPAYNEASVLYHWKSQKTGLQVVLVQHETPVVKGYFAVATEVPDDSGTPHTLEHLVFMGSHKFPFKGLLDTVGNKLLSTTNAWTGTDQTVYTLVTAGWEGFQQLLPVYLDHVLYPTLTDSACRTEVYHIDGSAEEKGVVFSEMQGVENTSSSLITEKARKIMYRADSGYSSETGGLMEALRSLSNDQIRQFHGSMYTPENLCVIITGDVDPDELISTMAAFDDSIGHKEDPNFKRPFVDSPDELLLKETISTDIDFPEADESFGEAQMSWIGPHSSEMVINTALDVLGSYLTTEGSGKLSLALVDIPEPIATDVSFYTDDFKSTAFHLYLSGVPVELLPEAEERVMEVIRASAKNFDLEFVRDCLERKLQKFILGVEKDPEILAYIALDNFLYGAKDGSDFPKWTQDVSEYKALALWTAQDWVVLINRYLLSNPHLTVRGRPSAKLFNELNEQKKDRIAKTRQAYGKAGLEKLAAELDEAQADNNKPIPESIIDSFAAPDLTKVQFIHTNDAAAGPALFDYESAPDSQLQRAISTDTPADFPLYIHFEDFKSQFVAVRVYLSSFVVEERLLPYVEVLLTELFAMPMVLPDGTRLAYDDVVREVKKETLENSIITGGQYEEFITVKLQAGVNSYANIIKWIVRAMWNTVFDKERIQVLVEKHLNSLSEEKRDGSTVLSTTVVNTTLNSRSLKRASDLLCTEQFYQSLSDQLNNGGFDDIKRDLEELRDSLFRVENMRVLVCGGISKLEHPVSAWGTLLDAAPAHGSNLTPIPRTIDVLSAKGRALDVDAIITPMSATESSYLALAAKGPSDYTDEDIPALAVCCSYLQAVEGPLWRGVRGTGLAYGASMYRAPEMGQTVLEIYRGTDAGKAVSASEKIARDLSTGATTFEKSSIEGAISSIVNSIASEQSDYFSAAVMKFFDNCIKKRGPDFNTKFMDAIHRVTEQDLRRVLQKYIVPMFDPATSIVFAACHVSMTESLRELFTSKGYNVEVKPLVGGDDSEDESEGDESKDEEDEEDSD